MDFSFLGKLGKVAENPAIEEEANVLAQKIPSWETGAPVAESGTVMGEAVHVPNTNIHEAPTNISELSEAPTKLEDTSFETGEPVAGTPDVLDEHDAMAHKIMPDASPETKANIAQWIRNNPVKSAVGATALTGGAMALMGGDKEVRPASIPARHRPVDESTYQNRSGIGQENDVHKMNFGQASEEAPAANAHVTSGIKPISKEVKAPGQPKPSSLEESAPSTINTVENLQQAQNADAFGTLANQLGRASELIGTGFSHAAPVAQDIFTEQSKAGKNVKNFEQLAEQEKNDPSSQVSKDFRDYAKKFGVTLPSSTSAVNAEKVMPYAFKQFEASELQKSKHEDLKYKYQELKAMKDISEANKAKANVGKDEEKQGKAYSELRNKLETFRGNQAAQQASKDVLSADKALQLVKNKDPNTLTTQDLALLAQEISKIAQGGVATEHGITNLMPNNLQTKAAEVQNFLFSKPTDAQAGEYIKKNMKYLDEMKNVAQGTLSTFRKNITKGYKGRISPEQEAEVMQDYSLGEHAVSPETGAASELVSVVDPSGRKGKIPKANLQKALDKGYKVTQ
jgi:hypothetical protein